MNQKPIKLTNLDIGIYEFWELTKGYATKVTKALDKEIGTEHELNHLGNGIFSLTVFDIEEKRERDFLKKIVEDLNKKIDKDS